MPQRIESDGSGEDKLKGVTPCFLCVSFSLCFIHSALLVISLGWLQGILEETLVDSVCFALDHKIELYDSWTVSLSVASSSDPAELFF